MRAAAGPRPCGGRGRRGGGDAPAAFAAPVLLPLVFVLAGPAPAGAQESPSLDRVEAAADSGRADSARALLDRWVAERSEGATPRARTRARFLRARLTADADSAARRYLRVAVEGGAEYGDRAWLRLAQLRLAGEEPERALRALDRLRSDYPGTELAAESWLWTGHARSAAGRPAGACAAWERAARAGETPDGPVRRQAREALRTCGGDEGVAGAEAAAPPADSAGAPAPEPAGTPADSARSGWAVQLGAFSDRAGAERLRSAVEERVPSGAELVVVPPGPGDDLFRLQTRPPADRSAARRLAGELEARGISAILVRTRP